MKLRLSMGPRRAGWLALISTIALHASAAAAPTPPRPHEAGASLPRTPITIDISGGNVVIGAFIGGRAVRAILDTGASATVLDRRYAESIGLASKEEVKVGGGAQQVAGNIGESVSLAWRASWTLEQRRVPWRRW